MKEHTVCFTGHRKISQEEIPAISKNLKKTLMECIGQGYLYFGAGGALGFDTIAAKAVLRLKNEFPNIKLILVLPCLEQTNGWNEESIKEYEMIKANADKVVYTSEHYYRGCMQKRNRHLVDNSSLCICYLKEEKGGTAYTVRYAQKGNLQIINIA